MRILWCTWKRLDTSLDRETWLGMTRALAARGHEVHLISTFRARPTDFGLDRHHHYVPLARMAGVSYVSFLARLTWGLFRTCRGWRPDVVLVDTYSVPAAIVLLKALPKVVRRPAIVLDVRTMPITADPLRRVAEGWLFRSAVRLAATHFDGMTAITPRMARRLAALAGMDARHIGVWSSGVDSARLDPERFSRRSEDEPEDAFHLLYHGALFLDRGLGNLIEAIALLRNRGRAVHLELLGDGPHREHLVTQRDAHGLQKEIAINPPVAAEAIGGSIATSDAGIIPFPDLECWRVSSPLKLLEYMAMEKPVIATRLECNTDILRDTRFVEWAQSSSPSDLAAAVDRAMVRSDDMKVAAKEARKVVLDEYTWERQAAHLEATLRRVAGVDE
jgi:glycosyltransferase involved in cell wall biosynthesis